MSLADVLPVANGSGTTADPIKAPCDCKKQYTANPSTRADTLEFGYLIECNECGAAFWFTYDWRKGHATFERKDGTQ